MLAEKIMHRFDAFIVKKNNWQYIPNTKHKIFYVVPMKYHGKTLVLEDGVLIQTGDIIAELHLNNPLMKEYGDVAKLMKDLKSEMTILAGASEEMPLKEVKAFFGVTLLHPIAKRLHFSLVELEPSFKAKFLCKWDAFLKKTFSAKKEGDHRKTKSCWLSKQSLQNHFGRK